MAFLWFVFTVCGGAMILEFLVSIEYPGHNPIRFEREQIALLVSQGKYIYSNSQRSVCRGHYCRDRTMMLLSFHVQHFSDV